jgi:hypothetical protein
MDRRPYTPRDRGATVTTLMGEQIRINSQPLPHAATVSLRGTFIDRAQLRKGGDGSSNFYLTPSNSLKSLRPGIEKG